MAALSVHTNTIYYSSSIPLVPQPQLRPYLERTCSFPNFASKHQLCWPIQCWIVGTLSSQLTQICLVGEHSAKGDGNTWPRGSCCGLLHCMIEGGIGLRPQLEQGTMTQEDLRPCHVGNAMQDWQRIDKGIRPIPIT